MSKSQWMVILYSSFASIIVIFVEVYISLGRSRIFFVYS